MTKQKWHKNCGGKVVYREPEQEGVGFERAGFCLKCEAFPIVQEDIIFKINANVYERFYDDKFPSWRITTKGKLKEVLD